MTPTKFAIIPSLLLASTAFSAAYAQEVSVTTPEARLATQTHTILKDVSETLKARFATLETNNKALQEVTNAQLTKLTELEALMTEVEAALPNAGGVCPAPEPEPTPEPEPEPEPTPKPQPQKPKPQGYNCNRLPDTKQPLMCNGYQNGSDYIVRSKTYSSASISDTRRMINGTLQEVRKRTEYKYWYERLCKPYERNLTSSITRAKAALDKKMVEHGTERKKLFNTVKVRREAVYAKEAQVASMPDGNGVNSQAYKDKRTAQNALQWLVTYQKRAENDLTVFDTRYPTAAKYAKAEKAAYDKARKNALNATYQEKYGMHGGSEKILGVKRSSCKQVKEVVSVTYSPR